MLTKTIQLHKRLNDLNNQYLQTLKKTNKQNIQGTVKDTCGSNSRRLFLSQVRTRG